MSQPRSNHLSNRPRRFDGPLINEGDIVAVDCAQIDPNQLIGKIVVTWQPQRGLMLSRFLLVNGPQMLESENLAY